MISTPDRAQRLADAILADVALYEEARIVSGCNAGDLDRELTDPLAEGLELFRSRVDPQLASGRFFDAALVKRLAERTRPWWRTGFDRLRMRYVAPVPCAACAEPLGPDRVAWQGRDGERWARLLACAKCQSVTGVRADAGSALEDSPVLEASAAVVVRVRERVERALQHSELETEILAISQDTALARLLGIPEISALAEPPAGRLAVQREMHLEDPFGAIAPPWPGEPPRLVPGPALASNPLHPGGAVARHTAMRYLARTADGWRVQWNRIGLSLRAGGVPVTATAHRDDVALA